MTAYNVGITIPQFAAPFSLNPDGTVVEVQQNTVEDIEACVLNILSCPIGDKLGDPTFGVPQQLFQLLPINSSALVAAIQQLEPRATYTVAPGAANGVSQNLTVTVQPQAGVAGA